MPPFPLKSPKKPGRNKPCPCGSTKKYKLCCGKPDPKGPNPTEVSETPSNDPDDEHVDEILSENDGILSKSDEPVKDFAHPILANGAILLDMDPIILQFTNVRIVNEENNPASDLYQGVVVTFDSIADTGKLRWRPLIRGPKSATLEGGARALLLDTNMKVAMMGSEAAGGERWVLEPLGETETGPESETGE